MDPIWLLILLPVAASSGWLMAKRDHVTNHKQQKLPEAYFKGLNFLLNEQPDKALKIFLEVVEVDHKTVEMHVALGNLFRRRGEVERATQIHQNLIARSDLDDDLRCLALFELAQDYFKAGLFDRAEDLFQELRDIPNYTEQACLFLIQIYDQEKEWERAIAVARILSRHADFDMSENIAHYYCELAEITISEGNNQKAEAFVDKAFKSHSRCVRAVIQSGRLASMRGNHANAIAIWRGLEYWAPEAMGEVVGHIYNSYLVLKDPQALQSFLENTLNKNADPRIIALLFDLMKPDSTKLASQNLLLDLLKKYPSLESLYHLTKVKSLQSWFGKQSDDYVLLENLLSDVIESGKNYHCHQCGFQSNTLHWQCPGCKAWGSINRCLGRKVLTPASSTRRPLS